MLGILVFLLLLSFLWLMGSLCLMAACWLANRILGPVPTEAISAELAEPAPVYRPVEAGPYTSPTTAQEYGTASGEDAVPVPVFARALAIMACSGLVILGLGALFLLVMDNTQPDEIAGLVLLGGLGLAAAAVHWVVLRWGLPTTFARALLVLVLEAIPMGLLIALPCFGVGIMFFSVRSAGPPPTAPVTAPAPRSAPPPMTVPAPTRVTPQPAPSSDPSE